MSELFLCRDGSVMYLRHKNNAYRASELILRMCCWSRN